uniref:WcaF family extracellular polysaccharide biosynthesis acetyltransferase n=1 Tax=Fulvivirga sp. TaxID=1931237 RepID=UPI004049D668
MSSRVRLDQFVAEDGLDRGKPKIVEMLWYLVKMIFFLSAFPWPSGLKALLLRLFGAKIGQGVLFKPRVNIHMPWKLTIGDYCWIGEEVFLLNLEPINIGSHVCISQRAFICTGNHNYKASQMPFMGSSITIANGAWVGAQVFVGPGVTIGIDAVITVGSILTSNAEAGMITGGNPATAIKPRW